LRDAVEVQVVASNVVNLKTLSEGLSVKRIGITGVVAGKSETEFIHEIGAKTMGGGNHENSVLVKCLLLDGESNCVGFATLMFFQL
jgi:hypothetical protein